MQTYRDHESLVRLASTKSSLGLDTLVLGRLGEEIRSECEDWASLLHVVVTEAQDTPKAIEEQLGFAILHNRWNGLHWESLDFTPSWDVVEWTEHWYILTFILSDDGFGVVVFMPRGDSNELTLLCDRYVEKEHPQ
ncbi:hypothetical protein ACIGHN_11940 [Acidovorax sp. NPDC077693]|uniref:hypothetical protein n=1 Tax=unclassified Acidovorax TaxID=2684926 RepID=UPI0037CC1509